MASGPSHPPLHCSTRTIKRQKRRCRKSRRVPRSSVWLGERERDFFFPCASNDHITFFWCYFNSCCFPFIDWCYFFMVQYKNYSSMHPPPPPPPQLLFHHRSKSESSMVADLMSPTLHSRASSLSLGEREPDESLLQGGWRSIGK